MSVIYKLIGTNFKQILGSLAVFVHSNKFLLDFY